MPASILEASRCRPETSYSRLNEAPAGSLGVLDALLVVRTGSRGQLPVGPLDSRGLVLNIAAVSRPSLAISHLKQTKEQRKIPPAPL